MKYPVIIHKDKNSDYGVTVPDLPGCYSAGETVEEALDQTREAILTHVEGLLLDNENIPQPSLIEKHQNNKKLRRVTFAIVDVDLSELSEEIQRVNITIPKRILTKLDTSARKEGKTRSGLLINAALQYLSSNKNNVVPS